MRIACPSCSAAYEVPESLLASGPRLLRCARCGHQFQASMPAAPAAAPAAPAQAAPAPAAPSPVAGAVPVAPAPSGPAIRPEPALAPEPPPEPLRPGPAEPRAAPQELPPPLAADSDRPPPTRGLSRHSPMDPPLPRRGTMSLDFEDEKPRSPAVLAAAWLLSLVVLGAAAWAGWHYREAVMQAWPPAIRLYQALGIA